MHALATSWCLRVHSRGEVVIMARITHTSARIVSGTASYHMELESVEDFSDLYQCGLGQEQLDGRMQPFADYFDVDECCDECEKQIIRLVRAHLHEYQRALHNPDGADDDVNDATEQCPHELEIKCLKSLARLASSDDHSGNDEDRHSLSHSQKDSQTTINNNKHQ
jgi:hypothetical protein